MLPCGLSAEKEQELQQLALKAFDVIGGQGWGHVSFDYSPVSKGILAKNIRGNLRGLKTQGSTLALYQRDTHAWETSFSGVIRTSNIAKVMENFGYPGMVTSKKTTFDMSINWPGYPDQLDVNRLAGTVDINMQKGKFITEQSEGDNTLLNLISLLNFDTLVRRLRLDFSDLSADGLAYDSVTGQLNFKNDYVYLKNDSPLTVDTTSADLQLVGDINLKQQTIDSQLVATLPIAGNLAVAAALTAGLPAAVGVYVVGKLFKEQMDDFASVRYNVTGSWSDPKMQVDKIFESQANKTGNANKPTAKPENTPSEFKQKPKLGNSKKSTSQP